MLKHIKELLGSGALESGGRLPAERRVSKVFFLPSDRRSESAQSGDRFAGVIDTHDMLEYNHIYEICASPTGEVLFERRKLLRCIRDEAAAVGIIRRHPPFPERHDDENHSPETGA